MSQDGWLLLGGVEVAAFERGGGEVGFGEIGSAKAGAAQCPKRNTKVTR